ncbi:hypothetical protein SAMN05660443_1072 [Marinospirillum celere]|uniref:Motility protein n=1 Tax=Marinospirillum celere TaxID=1122252 RepID=A0A1I1FKQ1_9GAMM|nr:hypothetical protein [Marinospirillum celere]SFB99871.1 hypothetical protein SAMN05660443_1072 [Marinospirillum celere]
MDFSGVSPEVIVQAVAQQREADTRIEAQARLVKNVQETQENAIMALMEAVPLPDARSGHNVNLKV